MELTNEKSNKQNMNNILLKFGKIKNTVINLKKVNKNIINFKFQSNEFLFLSLNKKSFDCLVNRNKDNIQNNKDFIPGKSYTLKQIKPKNILTNINNYTSEKNRRNKNIPFSKTEIELVNKFPNLNLDEGINLTTNGRVKIKNIKLNENFKKTKIKNRNKFRILDLNSDRSIKLNYTGLNKYKNNSHHLNSGRIEEKRIKKLTLVKYFNLKNDNKSINSYSVKTLYNKNKMKYNSYITKRNKGTFSSEINSIYNETGKIINNNINNSINKIKKEKELLNLKKILRELKTKNKLIKSNINSLKEHNLNLENKKTSKNKNIYLKIKNILTENLMINKNLNKNFDNKNINMINSKKYISLPCNEKIKFIRNIYLQEKLKNSLINKTHLLYVDSYNKKNINGAEISLDKDNYNKINLENIWNWIISMVEGIDNIIEYNNKIKNDINKFNKGKDIYKQYYNNWMNLFHINNKEELIKKIDGLINVKNLNENEEAKMFKILLNNKH